MGDLSLCDRIEVYATTGTGVTIPAEDAMKLVAAARGAALLAKELERRRAKSSGWKAVLERNVFLFGTVWGLLLGLIIFGAS